MPFTPDFPYLRRVADRSDPATIFLEPHFLDAQKLFFDVVASRGGTVDFEVADMHEVHAVAALWDGAKGMRVLDLGCGSAEPYVLEDTFRDRYPPFLAEMLTVRGARVTGVDIRPEPHAGYDHRVLDLTRPDWASSLQPPYDVIACFSLFNAPGSPFEHDASLCDRVLGEFPALLAPDGIVIVTLRDELFAASANEAGARAYIASKGFACLHLDGNCAWLRRPLIVDDTD